MREVVFLISVENIFPQKYILATKNDILSKKFLLQTKKYLINFLDICQTLLSDLKGKEDCASLCSSSGFRILNFIGSISKKIRIVLSISFKLWVYIYIVFFIILVNFSKKLVSGEFGTGIGIWFGLFRFGEEVDHVSVWLQCTSGGKGSWSEELVLCSAIAD